MGSNLFKDANIKLYYKIDKFDVKYKQTSFCSAEVEIKDHDPYYRGDNIPTFTVNTRAAELFDKYLEAKGDLIAKPLVYTLGCPDLKITGSKDYLTSESPGYDEKERSNWE